MRELIGGKGTIGLQAAVPKKPHFYKKKTVPMVQEFSDRLIISEDRVRS